MPYPDDGILRVGVVLYDRQPIPLPYRTIISHEQLLYLSRRPCHHCRGGMLPRQCHVSRDHVRILEETAPHQQRHDHEKQQRYPPPYDPGRHLPHHLLYLLAPQFYVLTGIPLHNCHLSTINSPIPTGSLPIYNKSPARL